MILINRPRPIARRVHAGSVSTFRLQPPSATPSPTNSLGESARKGRSIATQRHRCYWRFGGINRSPDDHSCRFPSQLTCVHLHRRAHSGRFSQRAGESTLAVRSLARVQPCRSGSNSACSHLRRSSRSSSTDRRWQSSRPARTQGEQASSRH